MTIFVLKWTFSNFVLKSLITGILKNLFMDSLHYTLSEEQIDYSKNPDEFLKNPTDRNKVLYNKQRNYCVSLLKKEKKKNTLLN